MVAMKLRSHEILSHPRHPIPTSSSSSSSSSASSRLKQLFQRRNLFKKKSPTSASIPTATSTVRHAIPDYVRKSILRFLLEPSSSSPSVHQQQSPSRNVRPPVMGIQALKTKKQQHRHQSKRSLRSRLQPIVDDASIPKLFDDCSTPNNYDMTILHLNLDDEGDNSDDNSMFASKTSTHQKKSIPLWARKNELQIAICNQLYFHRNPSEIFGNTNDCSPAHLRTILHSMLPNVPLCDDDRALPIPSNQSILV